MNETIADMIRSFIEGEDRRRDFWRPPLVGFAAAGDPLWARLKDVVCPEHVQPAEALLGATAAVVYFIPFAQEIVEDNADAGPASRRWVEAYVKTNDLVFECNRNVAGELKLRGHRTVLFPPTHNFDEARLVSAWSHKHVAFIAGLGGFGLHQMLITDAGAAGRLGSFVTDAPIQPTPRSEHERCLFLRNGSCGKCKERCPVSAIGDNRFDRHRCYRVCLANQRCFKKLGVADCCGKCACGVPCSLTGPA